MRKAIFYLIFIFMSLLNPLAALELDEATVHFEKMILGSGCFWGAEKGYESLPGVISAISGYADGKGVSPTYKEITKLKNKFNTKNHAEVVEVTYNKNIISARDLLIHYFESHDPTQVNRQGNDIGTQYRSIILYSNIEQRLTIEGIILDYQKLLSDAGYGKIATQIKPIKKFYKAENYHQDYIEKNPNGYCPDHSTGIKFSRTSEPATYNNSELSKGKYIVIIDAKDYCPYCEKFKTQVVKNYSGDIPIVFRFADQLNGLEIDSPTWATPTILFLQEGKEFFGHQGYMTPKDFYRALGYFKLGNSEAYKVAFEEGTDPRYCQEYELFKNTPEGIFVDKISGSPLFDTKDRFNSNSGWLSFTQPITGSVYTKPDNRFGMKRVEIRSVISDIHLGHVFHDGPNGLPRYCINATVLEFRRRPDVSLIKKI